MAHHSYLISLRNRKKKTFFHYTRKM